MLRSRRSYLYPDTGRVGKGLTGSSPDSTGFLSSVSVHHVTWLLGMAQCHRQSLKARRESRCHALSHDSRDRPYHQSAHAAAGLPPTCMPFPFSSYLEVTAARDDEGRQGGNHWRRHVQLDMRHAPLWCSHMASWSSWPAAELEPKAEALGPMVNNGRLNRSGAQRQLQARTQSSCARLNVHGSATSIGIGAALHRAEPLDPVLHAGRCGTQAEP